MSYLKSLNTKLFAEVTTRPQYLQNAYYPALDGLRGVAILIVMLGHFGLNHYLWHWHMLIIGDIGVHIFFVLSGFLITTLLLREKLDAGCISLRQFYIRRILRIIPVAYLFLVVLIFLNMFFKLGVSAADLTASFLFFKNTPMQNEPYTAHFWSLAVEGQFYITFPLLLAADLKRYTLLVILLIVAVPAISILGYYHVPFLSHYQFVVFLTKLAMYFFWKGPFVILIGSLFAILLYQGVLKPGTTKQGYFISAVWLLLAVVIGTPNLVFYTKYVSEYLTAILIGYVIVLTFHTSDTFLSQILKSKLLIGIGIISYSVYMWQELFIGVRIWQPWLSFISGYPIIVLILIKLAFVLAIAHLSYRYFELRFLKIGRRSHNDGIKGQAIITDKP